MEPLPPDDPQAQFKPTPPTELNMEMAKGIQTANHLILKYGVGKQRLQLLSKESELPLVVKWQRMMEIYLGAQLHVVAALGYETNEQGIMMYTQQLAQFVGTKCDPMIQDEFRASGRVTWRDMLVIAFDLDQNTIAEKYGNELSIVDARNIAHKVASALIEPNILDEVATRVRSFVCILFLLCLFAVFCLLFPGTQSFAACFLPSFVVLFPSVYWNPKDMPRNDAVASLLSSAIDSIVFAITQE